MNSKNIIWKMGIKRSEIIANLDEFFPPSEKDELDSIGLQVEGIEIIENTLISLDISTEVILKAVENNCQLIISHHPLYFENKNEWFKKNRFSKAKYEMLLKLNINLFIIHTNIDYSPTNSISIEQLKLVGASEIKSLQNNRIFYAKFECNTGKELLEKFKTNLNLDYELRTNFPLEEKLFKKDMLICSGTCGDEMFKSDIANNHLCVIGEMKHHNWVTAYEKQIKVIEIGHFSEKVFKIIIQKILTPLGCKIFLADETNFYR